MPNNKSAIKRMIQARKRAARNRAQRSRLKTAIKKVLNAQDGAQATQLFRETEALLDRLASRRIIHPNKAARQKARLARRVLALGGPP